MPVDARGGQPTVQEVRTVTQNRGVRRAQASGQQAAGGLLWDGGNLLAELNGAATGLVAQYVYSRMDQPDIVVIGGSRYDVHTDGVGNVIALTDSLTNLARTYVYDAHGQLLGGNDYAGLGGRDRARWKGALWFGEDLELYYMRERWYEPLTGRFLSEEPIDASGSVNPYVFGGDDPVDYADPNGMGPDPCPKNPTNPPPPNGPPLIADRAGTADPATGCGSGPNPDLTPPEALFITKGMAAEESCDGQMVLWPHCMPDPPDLIAAAERLGSYLRLRGFAYRLWIEHGIHTPNTIDCSHFVHQALDDAGCDVPYVTTADIGQRSSFVPSDPIAGGIWVVRYRDAKGYIVGHMGVLDRLDPNSYPLVVQAGKHTHYWDKPEPMDFRNALSVRYYLPVCP